MMEFDVHRENSERKNEKLRDEEIKIVWEIAEGIVSNIVSSLSLEVAND